MRNKIYDCVCKEKEENRSLAEANSLPHSLSTGAPSHLASLQIPFAIVVYNLIFLLLSKTKSRLKMLCPIVMSLFEFCILQDENPGYKLHLCTQEFSTVPVVPTLTTAVLRI